MAMDMAMALFGAGMTALECAVGYFGIYKPYRAEKKNGYVSSFGEYYWNR